jgi:hypothetical protein
MAGSVFTPYSTVADFFGQKPSWIPDAIDQQRIQSYQVYEEMYWNVPDTFKISLRGTNNLPIYVPAARTIVDTTLRYFAPDFRVSVVDSVSNADSTDSIAATMAIRDLFKREKIRSKMVGYKRYSLIQGDAVWHLTADESKPIGSRLTLTAIDPGMYFPINDEEDVDRRIGCHLAEPMATADGDRIRRVTYRKAENGRITVEEGIFKTDDWRGPEAIPEIQVSKPIELPPQITSLPVYHTKNFEEPGNPFGSSEVRGLERIMGGINQAVSDESLALALMGIGMYATDASHPIDAITKKPVPWQLGPGRVVHHDGTKWERIQGVGNTAESYGTHYYRLWEALKQASSTPDVAIGSVDVQVASSGIALALQLGPMLAKAAEKNDLFLDTQNQLFYDILTMWMAAYEQTTFNQISVDCVVGSAVPVDREARFTELNDMLDRGVIDTDYYRSEAKKLGYVFPDDIGNKAKAEFDDRNAQADPFVARLTSEDDPNAGNGGSAA